MVVLTGSQSLCWNGGQMICELTGARVPVILIQLYISHLFSAGDQDCPSWKLSTCTDSEPGMCRLVAKKQSQTYHQKLLGTIVTEDTVGLHTLPTAFTWVGFHIFKALWEDMGVKPPPATGQCTWCVIKILLPRHTFHYTPWTHKLFWIS